MTINTSYVVRGMTCEHCVRAVTEELSSLPGVAAVQVDLQTGGVNVSSEASLDGDLVRAAVDEAGYELVS